MKISRTKALKQGIDPAKYYRTVKRPKTFSHYVMNLPATALDFLADFIGVYAGYEKLFEPFTGTKLPMVHCYCFGPKGDDIEKDKVLALSQICEHISGRLGSMITAQTPDYEFWDVRDVAPSKRQYCASFRLPSEVAFRQA